MIVTTIKEEGVWREREAKVAVTWRGLERKKGWGYDKHQKGSGLKREVIRKKERKKEVIKGCNNSLEGENIVSKVVLEH